MHTFPYQPTVFYRQPPTWLEHPFVARVLECLGGMESDPRAWVVGGAARDYLAGRFVNDIDLATSLTPDEVKTALKRTNIHYLDYWQDHGMIAAIQSTHLHFRNIQITTLRKDVETDGRHAVIEYATDRIEDASRRDFTINALYLSADGAVWDPFGGRADLAYGRVRFIGDANTRICEDYLRVLRLFRFHAHFGSSSLSPELREICQTHSEGLNRLSHERVRGEILKTLAAPAPVAVWQCFEADGYVAQLVPMATNIDLLHTLVEIEAAYFSWPEHDLRPRPLRRLACLVTSANSDNAQGLQDILRLSVADMRDINIMLHTRLPEGWLENPAALIPLMMEIGTELTLDCVFLNAARRLNAGITSLLQLHTAIKHALPQLLWLPAPVFPIDGGDIIDLGIPPSPKIGQILREVQDWWASKGGTATRQDCLAKAKELV